MSSRWNRALMAAGLVGVSLASLHAQQRPVATPDQPPAKPSADEAAPSDLRPLLQPRRSELRLIVQFYNLEPAHALRQLSGRRQ
jgi:hypothetical protein